MADKGVINDPPQRSKFSGAVFKHFPSELGFETAIIRFSTHFYIKLDVFCRPGHYLNAARLISALKFMATLFEQFYITVRPPKG